ncbi:MAG TPA: aldo/keto reductase [Candidatus Saccharimonadales bacterium]|nr:aldo/keto reductase [Candidatus Saccharimonadales bacterium]
MKLNTGTQIPDIGFGTWQIEDGEAVIDAVSRAIDLGYRLIDTAKIYDNEKGVGRAIDGSDIPRDELFVTTKLWNGDQGYGTALDAFDQSLDRLALDFIDLYLIHWPGRDSKKRLDSWRALSEIYGSGRARAVGVSNFGVKHLEEILKNSKLTPAVNQIELHPFIYEQQRPVLDFCKQQGIVVEAYSPLARGGVNHPTLSKIADIYHKSPAQIMLRWATQQGTVPLPKSETPRRIKENIQIFDFELSDKDMQQINNLSN